MRRAIFFFLILLVTFGEADARVRWLSPRGSNSNTQTWSYLGAVRADTIHAWRTLGYADGNLVAGDTLMVMGGHYDTYTIGGNSGTARLDTTVANNRNQFHFYSGGSSYTSQIVVKAYGDCKAYIAGVGDPVYVSRAWFTISGNADWITLDGWSYLTPSDSLFIVFEGRSRWIYNSVDSCLVQSRWGDIRRVIDIGGSSGATPDHIKITGIEINGNFPPNAIVNNTTNTGCNYARGSEPVMWGGPIRYGIYIQSTSASGQIQSDTITSCYIHQIYYPCGDGGWDHAGDGDWSCGLPQCDNPATFSQGTGEAIYLVGAVRKCYIADNTLEDAAHAALTVGGYWPRLTVTPTVYPTFNKFINNKIKNAWGGGLYLNVHPRWNLVEGNIIVHSGESTSKTKAGMSIGGSCNTVRKNVLYTPDQNWPAFDLQSQLTSDVINADSNYVYNNTIFGAHYESIVLSVTSDTCTRASVNANLIANNICYNSWGTNRDFSGSPRSEIALFLYRANNVTNWLDPDDFTSLPQSTHFGGNRFFNNCAKKLPADSTAYIVAYQQDADYDDAYSMLQYSFPTLESSDPIAWRGNISLNPLLVSEDPDGYGKYLGWWHIQATSPCVDAGTYIDDPWGAYVNSIYPGYGWDSLAVIGSQHDIGAFEFSETVAEECSILVTSPARDSVLQSKAEWVHDVSYDITWTVIDGPNSKIELYKGGVFQGTISATTPNDGTYSWTVSTYGGALATDYSVVITALSFPACADTSENFAIVGVTSCSVAPLTLSFGNLAIGDSTASQNILITNTGDYTLTGNIVISSVDFDITSGGGAVTLTPFQTRTVSVRFHPLTGGAKSAYILAITECAIVTCDGGALDVAPATIGFSPTTIGACSDPLPLIISNTGTGTIAGTITESCPDFEIVSGDGMYSLTTGQSHTIYIRFCPLTVGSKSCEINY
jgi:hypothetical protein